MVWIRPSVVVLMIVIQTCSAGRLERMERRLEMKLKAFQAYVEVRLDATDGDFGTLADRVSKLEAIVSTSENDISEKRSNGSRNEHTKAYTKPEVNHIQNTLTMYKRSFEKQKQEMNDVKMVFKDALSVFLNNASLTVSTLFNAVNEHVNNSADDISATLKNVSDTVVKSGSHLRSDIFTYLGNLSSEVKTELALHVEGATDDNNKTLIALNSQVRDHIANETESLEVFKTKILQDVNEARALVQNETTELEKKVEELIGRAKEVVGIIDEQRSTIEDGIMVTNRALHSSWSDWSAWSDCSQSCDSGRKSRHRSCDVTPPTIDGICIGNATETEQCFIHEFCPYLDEWSPWSQCSKTCNTGTMTRDRTCHAPASLASTCHGNITESQTCLMLTECPQTTTVTACGGFLCSNGGCIPDHWVCNGIRSCLDGGDERNCETRTCATDKFRCSSGQCVDTDVVCDGITWGCRDGSDEQNCDTCASGAFLCSLPRKCIREKDVCDGHSDCLDGSDEENCETRTCTSSQFRCSSGQCIPNSWACNGNKECRDDSDEENCETRTCTSSQFRCSSGQCIPNSWACNGNKECRDDSDEENCETRTCATDKFRCSSGQCVDTDLVCDGFPGHCRDQSDEENCDTCASGAFLCSSGRCIRESYVCNGLSNCPDGSDEENCETRTCASDKFRCSSGLCIDKGWICDGDLDCTDGADEENCDD
ncbi:low-density lipoprotein receptor-related protein 2-like isoform X2 [Mya arenaria]|uniref:low-density lipoprotein receptor-related protein 2-like isoform X2 n=1 Tax=Mya arenaria TaxID=6604 RepID=UPI0022E4F188|nr:low-density lipoprotein receptor-related protein 2-like isoform X2 [Mya arenaria]